ncbi:MAG: aromatic ring-hydroxylating dioxygenase subunit alpha, partial [Pseudomonadota bacterium]
SLYPALYVSDDIAEIEINAVFRSTWFCIGRADILAEPGDYMALDIVGQALLLVRGDTGELSLFANSCRHRGARLLNGEGTCRAIRCPFHAWSYRLDGTLASAPHMQKVPGFSRDELGLVTHRVEERAGFVFVCLSESAADLDDVLGDFLAVHAPWPLERLITKRRREFTVNCNWKSFLEVFNEYYHLPFVHPTTVNGVYSRPDSADATQGNYASQFGRTEGTGGLLQDQQEMALPEMPGLQAQASKGVRYTWVFPNMTFAAGRDALWVYEAYPLGAGTCRVVQSACFPPETLSLPDAEARVSAYLHRLDAAIDEDIPALENQQLGLFSPDAVQGPLQPLLEANVAGFSSWYAGMLLQRSSFFTKQREAALS